MGNHEFNALAYATKHPPGSGCYLRPHIPKNERQHHAFLEQLDPDERDTYLHWIWSISLWLDLDGLRIVHACWHAPSIRIVREALGGDRFTSIDQLARASTKGDELYDAVETLLKGPELDLGSYGQPAYRDKGGDPRHRARIRWWTERATTLREVALIDPSFETEAGDPYPELPSMPARPDDRSFVYTGKTPVLFGHYWRTGSPKHFDDWNDQAACLDFSTGKGGPLTAYRWSGEHQLLERQFFQQD